MPITPSINSETSNYPSSNAESRPTLTTAKTDNSSHANEIEQNASLTIQKAWKKFSGRTDSVKNSAFKLNLENLSQKTFYEVANYISEEQVIKKFKHKINELAEYFTQFDFDNKATMLNLLTTIESKNFLSSYLVGKSDKIFELSKKDLLRLRKQAQLMLQSFENLCTKVNNNDTRSLTALSIFINSFSAYRDNFLQCEKESKVKILSELITAFIKLDKRKFSYLDSPGHSAVAMLEGINSYQESLIEQIKQIGGSDGVLALDMALSREKYNNEQNLLSSLQSHQLLHEIAVNPNFEFSSSDLPPLMSKATQDLQQKIANNKCTTKDILLNIIPLKQSLASICLLDSQKAMLDKIYCEQNLMHLVNEDKSINEDALASVIYSSLKLLKSMNHDSVNTTIDHFLQNMPDNFQDTDSNLLFLPLALSVLNSSTAIMRAHYQNLLIRKLRPSLKEKAAVAENAIIEQNLQSFEFSLDNTSAWLNSFIAKAQKSDVLKACLNENKPISSMQRVAILDLLFSKNNIEKSLFPELLFSDFNRLDHMQKSIKKLTIITTAIILTKNMARKFAVNIAKERIAMLHNELVGVDTENQENRTAHCLQFLRTELLKHQKTASGNELVSFKSQLKNEISHHGPVYKYVSSKLFTELNSAISINHIDSKKLAMGDMGFCTHHIGKIAKHLKPIITHNYNVNRLRFKKIFLNNQIKALVDYIFKPNLTTSFLPQILQIHQDSISSSKNTINKVAVVCSSLTIGQQLVNSNSIWLNNQQLSQENLLNIIRNENLFEAIVDDEILPSDLKNQLQNTIRTILTAQQITISTEEMNKANKMIDQILQINSPGIRLFLDEIKEQFLRGLSGNTLNFSKNLMLQIFTPILQNSQNQINRFIKLIEQKPNKEHQQGIEFIPPAMKTGR